MANTTMTTATMTTTTATQLQQMFVGAVFFKSYSPETAKQELTWVDACYWATVTATSIGYGDIVPQTDGGRFFLIFYMLISTVVTAGLLGDFIDLYVGGIVGEDIIGKIIDSTTWVHKVVPCVGQWVGQSV